MNLHSAFVCFVVLCSVAPLQAEDSASTLPVLAAPDLRSPLDGKWKIAHGSYEPKEGVLVCAENPANKHVAVIWHLAGWNQGTVDMEFKLDGSKILIVGCDGDTPKGLSHIGRVVITPKLVSIADDAAKPSHTLAKAPCDLASGVWHKLHIAWSGDKIDATVNDAKVTAAYPYLASNKTRSWIAVGGQTASLRNIRICGRP